MRPKKFTLIELLIVVAVIAILTGLLIPALNSARNKSYTAVCMSNLRQLHGGLSFYASDWDGHFPYGFIGGGLGNEPQRWLFQIENYLKQKINQKPNNNVFWCKAISSPYKSSTDGQKSGYTYLEQLGVSNERKPATSVRQPSRWPVLADAGVWNSTNLLIRCSQGMDLRVGAWHRPFLSNAVFIDGHTGVVPNRLTNAASSVYYNRLDSYYDPQAHSSEL